MKMLVLAVYDSATEAYLQPIFTNAKGSAVRTFMDLAEDPSHPFSKHTDHYSLFEIGTWDDNRGVLTTMNPIRIIGLWEATEPVMEYVPELKLEKTN